MRFPLCNFFLHANASTHMLIPTQEMLAQAREFLRRHPELAEKETNRADELQDAIAASAFMQSLLIPKLLVDSIGIDQAIMSAFDFGYFVRDLIAQMTSEGSADA